MLKNELHGQRATPLNLGDYQRGQEQKGLVTTVFLPDIMSCFPI